MPKPLPHESSSPSLEHGAYLERQRMYFSYKGTSETNDCGCKSDTAPLQICTLTTTHPTSAYCAMTLDVYYVSFSWSKHHLEKPQKHQTRKSCFSCGTRKEFQSFFELCSRFEAAEETHAYPRPGFSRPCLSQKLSHSLAVPDNLGASTSWIVSSNKCVHV